MNAIWGTLAVLLPSLASAGPSTLWTVPERGEATARLSVETELSVHRMATPTSVAPDLTLGLVDRVALAVHYSRASHAQIGAGNGVCVAGPRETLGLEDDSRCSESETGLGVAVHTRIAASTLARTGLTVRGPSQVSAELGTATKWQRAPLYLLVAPTLLIAASGRDRGNRERIQTALYLGFTFSYFELHARTGVEGALQTFEDTFAIPLGGGVSAKIGGVSVGFDAGFDRAFGALNTMRWRSASVFVETSFGGAS